ncbi:energy-coupling factor transporter transmembrane component T family protein [Leptolyngbya sp. AN03gr2]|uniref:energy-coupling factor transporter transmembrane component T family protein n=1 Tax=unclassified Leptolyngbya TaxID=2650499 RepID=UPI003D31C4E8
MFKFLFSINPLLKIGISLAIVTVALSLKTLDAIAFLVIVLLILFLTSIRIQAKNAVISAIAFIGFVAFGTWTLANWQLALFYALRLLALLLPAPVFAFTTSPTDLVRALQAIKLPSFLVLSLMLTWRFLPVIQQESQRILEANQLRGVDLSRQPHLWFSSLFVPLVFRIVSYADEVTIGLETRGYDPDAPRTISKPLTWQAQDTVFTIAALLVFGIVAHLEL